MVYGGKMRVCEGLHLGRIADFTKGKLVMINSGEPKRRCF
jgi:hypothetical protein